MHAPSVILADRGEMESRTADLLCKHLGIAVENAPPYRGDLKGIIEKHFIIHHITLLLAQTLVIPRVCFSFMLFFVNQIYVVNSNQHKQKPPLPAVLQEPGG